MNYSLHHQWQTSWQGAPPFIQLAFKTNAYNGCGKAHRRILCRATPRSVHEREKYCSALVHSVPVCLLCTCLLWYHAAPVCLINPKRFPGFILYGKVRTIFLILTNTVYACFYLFIFNYSCNPKETGKNETGEYFIIINMWLIFFFTVCVKICIYH